MNIRKLNPSDLPATGRILQDTALFPADMLEAMTKPFFEDTDHPDLWFVGEIDDDGVVGFAYVRPEPLTDRTWNLLAIGIRSSHQGKGYGSRMLTEIERALATERILIVDTSGLDEYARTRAFYAQCGYHQEAVIRDYWATGDDKVTFRKPLGDR
ncbi:MAG: GNAT family N-acetyltransferase [Pseudomonadota bacterium]